MRNAKPVIPIVRSIAEQDALWLEGRSVHSDHRGLGPECTPDFSCCNPELLQPREVRQAFLAADELRRNKFLGMFLGALLTKVRPNVRIHVITGEPELES